MKVKIYLTGPSTFITEVESIKSLSLKLDNYRKKGFLYEFIDNNSQVYINPEHVICVQELVEAPVEAPVVDRIITD